MTIPEELSIIRHMLTNHTHIRIDEGIRRGPKTRAGRPTQPSPKADIGTWQIPPDLDPKVVLDRYMSEETTARIASQYGVSRKAMVKWLREVAPKEWKQVQILRALCRKDDAEEGLEVAWSALSLARARELLRAGQWDLERLDSVNYGQKQEVSHKVEVNIRHVEFDSSAAELLGKLRHDIEGTCVVEPADEPILP